jgi:hypothetical protein
MEQSLSVEEELRSSAVALEERAQRLGPGREAAEKLGKAEHGRSLVEGARFRSEKSSARAGTEAVRTRVRRSAGASFDRGPELERQDVVADADGIAGRNQAPVHALPVHPRSVGASQIANDEGAVLLEDLGVEIRDGPGEELNLVRLVAPDPDARETRIVERVDLLIRGEQEKRRLAFDLRSL